MKKVDVVRAWRDAEYRSTLDADVRNSLPASPAGIVDINDDALRSITGGCGNTNCSCGPPPVTSLAFSCLSTGQGAFC
jgi:mersacidin/lichenicidin family type 2 lantibiotic